MLFLGVLALWLAPAGLYTAERAIVRGEYRLALDHLASAAPRDDRWHFLASRAWDGLNDPARAVAEAEEALKLQPRNPVYHLHLAQIFLSRNTPAAAVEILTEAESLFPSVFMIRLGKGLAQKEMQLYEGAETTLKWCLAQQPDSPLAFDALATIYLHLSRFDDLKSLASEFLKHNPSDYRGYYFLAAGQDGELSAAAETLRLLEDCKRRNPSFAAAHALTGKVLLREDKPADAVNHLKRAVELRPDLVQAHLHLARALRAIGDETAAAKEFETVRQLKQKEQEPVPRLLYHRGKRSDASKQQLER